ncbi:MAG: flagellar regulator YcgR PilZN domain-containing protein [Thiogranum sp.]|nr:flagellar regulator YcgR PilZN domain-containing protein [Thiogranum sp.]
MLLPEHLMQHDCDTEGERIRGQKRIIALLRQLQAGHALLSMTVPGCSAIANTAILGIKDDRGFFLLDELSANVTHEAFLKAKKAVAKGRLNGTEMYFNCQLVKTGADDNMVLYAIRLPDEIIRKQRRNQFRLRLSPAVCVPVEVSDPDGCSTAGELHDLSTSGLGALLQTRHCPEHGQRLSRVSIALPGSAPFITELEVRFSRIDKTRHMLRLGGRFLTLTQQQERKLEQFLAEQQRKRCRYDGF